MSNVDHPSHYNQGRIEVISVIEDWNLGFNLGNTVKYIGRARFKGKMVEDLEKARWYLDRAIMNAKKLEQEQLEERIAIVQEMNHGHESES